MVAPLAGIPRSPGSPLTRRSSTETRVSASFQWIPRPRRLSFSNQLSQRPSNAPVCRRTLDSPKVAWAVKLHSHQPRNTLKKRDRKHNMALFARASRNQRQHHRSLILYPFSNDNSAAMRVDEHCLAFFMKGACRIEAGDYNRNFQRQARTTSGSVLALLQSPLIFAWEQVLDTFRPEPVAAARISELAFPRVAKLIRWSSSVALLLNC